MKILDAIRLLTNRLWHYEGSTTIDGRRAYIMRKYDQSPNSTQTVIYFTTRGLREQAKKEMTK